MPDFRNSCPLRRFVFVLLVSLILPALPLRGQEPGDDLPPILSAGFHAYRMGGPDEAVRTWLRGSPLEGSHDAGAQESALHMAQAGFGAFRGFDLVAARDVSSSTRILYFTLDYERGPLFAKFVLYRTDTGWIVTSLLFDPSDAAVLPPQ